MFLFCKVVSDLLDLVAFGFSVFGGLQVEWLRAILAEVVVRASHAFDAVPARKQELRDFFEGDVSIPSRIFSVSLSRLVTSPFYCIFFSESRKIFPFSEIIAKKFVEPSKVLSAGVGAKAGRPVPKGARMFL